MRVDYRMRKVILASQSPWRKEILARTGIPFSIEKSNYEEDLTLPLLPKKLVLEMARGKAEDVALRHRNVIVIAADTIAVFRNHVIGKPITPKRAKEVLAMLAGNWHEAMTGLVVIDTKSGKRIEKTIVTKVHMRQSSRGEREAYVRTGEPLEVAGAYALQSRAGVFVDEIRGDYWNIVGLPLAATVEALSTFGIKTRF
jgi:septum formation protein